MNEKYDEYEVYFTRHIGMLVKFKDLDGEKYDDLYFITDPGYYAGFHLSSHEWRIETEIVKKDFLFNRIKVNPFELEVPTRNDILKYRFKKMAGVSF